MITVLGLVFGAVLLIGVILLVMKSGNKGGRNRQSSNAIATEQREMSNPRGDVRSGTGPD